VTADGQRFRMVRPDAPAGSPAASRPQINIVEHGFEELRERVPLP